MLNADKRTPIVKCTVLSSSSYAKQMPKSLGVPYFGKARLVYDIPDSASNDYPLGKALIITTDNISTHNIIHNGAIPYKGYVLNALSIWGFKILNKKSIPNHMISYGNDIFEHLKHLSITREDYPGDLHLRAMVCEKLEIRPVEFIFRQNLCGSLYKDYLKDKDDYHLNLPVGLKLMHQFDKTIFTPTRKSKNDEPLPFKSIIDKYPDEYQLALKTWDTYREAFAKQGLTLVDGKLEIGLKIINDQYVPVVADEPPVTPDSIRLVKSNEIETDFEPNWIGKENVRQLVEKTWRETNCPNVAIKIAGDLASSIGNKSYLETLSLITGKSLSNFLISEGFRS